jgi:hypothetical protein
MNSFKIDASEIKQAMSGRWLDILPAIDNRLAPAIKAAGRAVPCPLGTSSDGFRIPLKAANDGHAYCGSRSFSDGLQLIMWLKDCTFYEALKSIDNVVNNGAADTSYHKPVKPVPKTDYTKRRALFDRWLHESTDEPNNAAINYYHKRGLHYAAALRSGALRYLDALPYLHDGEYVRGTDGALFTTPAILCGMRCNDYVTGFNIIRIDEEGNKATNVIREALANSRGIHDAIVNPKQLFTIREDIRGSCFRLGKTEKIWNVGEGVETLLAVAAAFGTESVAAASTAAMLENIEVPEGVEVLRVFADKDRNKRGELAAEKLKLKYSDRLKVEVYTPPKPIPSESKGIDWLDVPDYLNTLVVSLASNIKGL